MKSMGYELRLVAHFGFWSNLAILEQALPSEFFLIPSAVFAIVSKEWRVLQGLKLRRRAELAQQPSG